MPFHSGRVTFCRFTYEGESPAAGDESVLEKLHEYRFTESPIGAPNEVEAGWTTGEHLFDTQFTYEKNGFGDLLLFALRIDTHKVPPAVKQAYKLMNIAAAAEGNPSGFASRKQKQEANDATSHQLHEDLAAGRFRKSKAVPIMWDLSSRTIYCGGASNVISENLVRVFRETFDLDLSPMSSGTLAAQLSATHAHAGRFDDLKPSAFTNPPAGAADDHEDASGPRDITTPAIPWVAKAVDMKDFLGNEFALWLWWKLETSEGVITITTPTGDVETFIALDKTLDMDCAWDVGGKQSLRGPNPTRLREAASALVEGKWPRKMGMILADGENQWEFTFQADRFIISGAGLPEIEQVEHPRELLEGRLMLTRQLTQTLDGLLATFMNDRLADGWSTTKTAIRSWITERASKRRA